MLLPPPSSCRRASSSVIPSRQLSSRSVFSLSMACSGATSGSMAPSRSTMCLVLRPSGWAIPLVGGAGELEADHTRLGAIADELEAASPEHADGRGQLRQGLGDHASHPGQPD